ncbi:MAG: class I SAM-dependent DNA methyltransferase [Gammaproteobacteria bacterium]|nr:class I SAM-dependent DNA methyltransferase [Gammaproteobacteria bacterium]
MPLSWNEIKARAARFTDDWQDAHYEKGETQTFYNEFFEVFGNRRRNVAVYEEKVKKINDKQGFIDLFWPGHLLVEQKSAGRDLAKARVQATDYFLSITEKEKPRFILLSDFQTFELLDLEENEEHHFTLAELPDNVRHFAFIAGYQQTKYRDQDPANIEASELMSNLHKLLEESGYTGHSLERLLVRFMFCLFAEDTGIFPMESFLRLIEDRTAEDGSDLGGWLIHLFEVLNTPVEKRQKNLDEDLAAFPYVNGQLFADPIGIPSFDSAMRDALLKCTYFNWTKVSPALFGSLFQTVMLPESQRQGGAHYTSEKNILKIIQPLFLDELRNEFEHIKSLKIGRQQKFEQLQDKISELAFFDPACGCGNFLILALRELRELELEILEALNPNRSRQRVLDIGALTKISLDNFCGIEIEEFPARIAEAAMWLVDHQMNMRLSESFGQAYVRLPLKTAANIYHGNAVTKDWSEVISASKCSYILGNPPFIGKKEQTKVQKSEVNAVFEGVKGKGVMDYVACWYIKAAKYIQNTNVEVAFVSTKSIVQGEQVGILWNEIYKYSCHISFAHRTFKWTIDEKRAKGMKIAAVHVVIVGFSSKDVSTKKIYEYETVVSDPHVVAAKTINAYLVEGPEVSVFSRRKVLSSNAPEMKYGSIGIDGGHLVLTQEERKALISKEPAAEPYIRPFVGADEYIKGKLRYCLWLKDIAPDKLRHLKNVLSRVEKVKQFRLASDRKGTKALAATPSLFGEIRQPDRDYLIIPKVSSETRLYIPIGYCDKEYIANGSSLIIPSATLYDFGIVTSGMHMSWMRYIGGRTKSDYQYSSSLIYNNFPWPEANDTQKEEVSKKAQAVLDARKNYPDSTLADLYDPNTMPPDLFKAHQSLDKAVDKAYRKAAFSNEKERIEYLFQLYQALTTPLIKVKEK